MKSMYRVRKNSRKAHSHGPPFCIYIYIYIIVMAIISNNRSNRNSSIGNTRRVNLLSANLGSSTIDKQWLQQRATVFWWV